MDRLRTFGLGVPAGLCIGIGGAVFLSLDNKVLGALFFTVGLFVICTFGFSLFTGKVCYVFGECRRYALDLLWIWLGNLCGTVLAALTLRCTRVGDALAERAQALCAVKLGDNLLSIFILAVFCDILIFVAVDGFRNNPHELGKYLALFFGVMVFILCGFEHCVANMFYFTMAGAWSGKTLLYVLVMSLGNAVGGVLLPLLRRATQKTMQKV